MKPRQAAVYVRISSDPDGLRLGVTRQEEDCRALAQRLGWIVAEVYADNDVSASKGKRRPEFERMLRDCETGKRDGILVYNTDRLTRRLVELATFLDWRDRNSVPFASTEGDDSETANGRMVIEIKGVVAQQEARRISERVKRSHLQLAQQGKIGGGGSRPYGYEQDRRTVRPAEAAVIRRIAEHVLAGESLTSIAKSLDNDGIPCPAASNRWQRGVIKRMMIGPRLAGLRVYRGAIMLSESGEPVRGEWEPILDTTTWEAVREVLTEPARNFNAGRIDRKYLLSGFLRCNCGAKMYGVHKHGQPEYMCPTLRGCGKTHRKAIPLDAHVTELVLRYLEGQEVETAVEEAGTLDAEIAEAERSLSALIDEWNAGRMSDQVFFTAQARKEASLNALKSQRTQHRRREAHSAPIGQGVRAAWEAANLSQRRAIIAEVLLAIQVLPKPLNAPKRFDPQYYVPIWKAG